MITKLFNYKICNNGTFGIYNLLPYKFKLQFNKSKLKFGMVLVLFTNKYTGKKCMRCNKYVKSVHIYKFIYILLL